MGNFDARERLGQKLKSVDAALDHVIAGAEAQDGNGWSPSQIAEVASTLPENTPPSADQVPGVHHPWKNRVGFESQVPRDLAGGSRFGQPEPALEAQIAKLRYPTMQRVAHT